MNVVPNGIWLRGQPTYPVFVKNIAARVLESSNFL